jgi:hypothetical protein
MGENRLTMGASEAGRQAWVQVGRGKVTLNGLLLDADDGTAINREEVVNLTADDKSEILSFDLR